MIIQAKKMALSCWLLWKWQNEENFNRMTMPLERKLCQIKIAFEDAARAWDKLEVCELDSSVRQEL